MPSHLVFVIPQAYINPPLRPKSVRGGFLLAESLFVAGAAAAELGADFVLEGLELGRELGKEFKVGVLFEHVVEESHCNYEFLGVLVFFEYAGSAHALCHGGEVMMSAEVEIHHFGHFTVLCFNHVEEVGLFFFVHNLLFILG